MNIMELFAVSQISPATAQIYSVQMHSYVAWLKRERKARKPEKSTTADGRASKQILSPRATPHTTSTNARPSASLRTVRAARSW
jgi:hypothetical protein